MLDDVTRHRERVLNLICANLVSMHRFSLERHHLHLQMIEMM